jgi:hypothetical protein
LKKFEYIIQVPNSGSITIPAQKFVYFDTNLKVYKTLNSNEITLQITKPSNEPEQTTTTNLELKSVKTKPFKQITKDIGFIEEDLANKTTNWSFPFWLFLIILISPLLIIFNLNKKLLSYLKKNKLFKQFAKKSQLSKFQKEFEKLKDNKKTDKIYSFFIHLLATKFELNSQAITTELIENKLNNVNWPTKKITEFTDYLNECASLHFITTEQKLTPTQINDLFKKGLYWIMLLTNKN